MASVDCNGRARPLDRRWLHLSPYQMAPFRKFRRMVRCFPIYLVPSLSPIHAYTSLGRRKDGENERAGGAKSANPTTPQRAGDEPSAPPPRRPCTASGAARREGVVAFCAKNQLPPGATEDFIFILLSRNPKVALRAGIHCGADLPKKNYSRRVIQPAFYVAVFAIPPVRGVCPRVMWSFAKRMWIT